MRTSSSAEEEWWVRVEVGVCGIFRDCSLPVWVWLESPAMGVGVGWALFRVFEQGVAEESYISPFVGD